MADDVGSYGAAKTIKEVLNGIAHNKYVLPSIQRQFVWKHGQIEELFDSLLRGYPVGTFMFWKLDVDSQNKGIIKLYEFYKDIEEDKNIDNTEYNSLASNEEVFAVIDGQQRLTALNIGLFGSYAYRKKGTWKTGNYPKRRLYLDLKSYVPESDNDPKKYNFKFLTEEESQNGSEHNWYKVGEILKIKNEKEMDEFTDKENLVGDSREIFRNLFRTIAQHKTISYYLVEEQKPDEVLDIFIRANSGGTPLSKSDLLMSMATHLWTNVDIRKEMVEVIDSVAEFGRGEKFRINRDFVLKTCLVLHSEDVKSLLVNFNPDNIHRFEENWVETRKCIECAFEYLDKCGFDDRTLQAKGPVISLIYYIYSNNLQDSINKDIFDKDGTNRKNIITWLIRVFVNGIYGGAPDSTHIKFRKILRDNPGKFFPYDAILEAYSKEGNGLHVSEEVLRNRLETSKFGSDKAGYLLILIYSDLANKSHTHIDHLHPKSVFKSGDYKKVIPGEDWEFVEKTWNTVLNLQLLEETLNESKNDMPLSDWLKVSGKDKSLLFIDKDTSTDLKDYRKFIENREKKLLSKLKTILNLSNGEEDTIEN